MAIGALGAGSWFFWKGMRAMQTVRVIENIWLVVESRRVYAEADLGSHAGGTLDIGGTFLYYGIQFVRRDAVPAPPQAPE